MMQIRLLVFRTLTHRILHARGMLQGVRPNLNLLQSENSSGDW